MTSEHYHWLSYLDAVHSVLKKLLRVFLISNFRCVLNVVCFLLGNSTPTCLLKWSSVPKRRHIKFRRRGITQKKAYKLFTRLEVMCVEFFQGSVVRIATRSHA